jgi:hypothetical protein
MVPGSFENSHDGREGFPLGIRQELVSVEECQVTGGKEDVGLDTCKEDKTQNEQVQRLTICFRREVE